MVCAVRGAISVEENTPDQIAQAVAQLAQALIAANPVTPNNAVAVFFTMTSDLTTQNPATAFRVALPGWSQVPLLCSQEIDIEGMMPRVIRILMQWRPESSGDITVTHIYLEAARHLRPDL